VARTILDRNGLTSVPVEQSPGGPLSDHYDPRKRSVYLSEPGLPHAWPKGYARVLEHNVVGLSVLSGSLIVLTDGYPYIVATTDPAAGISVTKIDALFPCVSGRGIVKLANAVAYPTNDGIAVYASSVGSQLITKFNYNDDTWKADLDPRTIIAGYYNEAYFASHGIEPQTGVVPEPTPPTVTPAPLPPEPLGGPIDGGSTPPTPEEPLPVDPAVAYEGTIVTGTWEKNPTGGGTDDGEWTGYVDIGIRAGTDEVGERFPEDFLDGVLSLVEVSYRIQYISHHGVSFPYEPRTYISINGYTTNPNGTAAEPYSVRVGDVILLMEDAGGYDYDSGRARWRWNGDKFGFGGTTGLVRDVTIRMTA